jgi:hypothetical protein
MKQSKFTDEQIIGFLKQAEAGDPTTFSHKVERIASYEVAPTAFKANAPSVRRKRV